jgi:hypothetical protein
MNVVVPSADGSHRHHERLEATHKRRHPGKCRRFDFVGLVTEETNVPKVSNGPREARRPNQLVGKANACDGKRMARTTARSAANKTPAYGLLERTTTQLRTPGSFRSEQESLAKA